MVKVAWIQGKSQGTIEKNLSYLTQKIREACSSIKPDLVILQELCLTDYLAITEAPENFDLAFHKDAEEIKHFLALAKELSINLVFPFFEKVSPAVYFNSLYVIDREGQINCHYRKMHIPDDPGFYEKYYFRAGDKGFQVADVKSSAGDSFKVGCLICWDQWFPEAARINALKGAQILIYPTAIGWDGTASPDIYQDQLEAWFTSMRAHAIANHVFVIAVNRVGKEGHLDFWGNSFCVDPYGRILERNGQNETISHLDLDLKVIDEANRYWPYFRDRRVDAFSDLLKIWVE